MKLGIFKNNELIHTVMGDISSLEIKNENNTAIEVLQDGKSIVTINAEPVEFRNGSVDLLPEVYFAMV